VGFNRKCRLCGASFDTEEIKGTVPERLRLLCYVCHRQLVDNPSLERIIMALLDRIESLEAKR
jgi:hypothetical protein